MLLSLYPISSCLFMKRLSFKVVIQHVVTLDVCENQINNLQIELLIIFTQTQLIEEPHGTDCHRFWPALLSCPQIIQMCSKKRKPSWAVSSVELSDAQMNPRLPKLTVPEVLRRVRREKNHLVTRLISSICCLNPIMVGLLPADSHGDSTKNTVKLVTGVKLYC